MQESDGTGAAQPLASLGFISVLVPARDEAENIGLVIEKTLGGLAAQGLQGEMIIVDDGSTDGTRDVALGWAAHHPEVRVISHRTNLAQSAAS